MFTMREKGYSFQEIAAWLSEKLGIAVKRSQVAYILTTPSDAQLEAEQRENMMDEADEQGSR